MRTRNPAASADIGSVIQSPMVRHRYITMQVAKNPPLAVRTTVRTRRWYMQRLVREAQFIAEPFKLYLTEDFHEAARAFTEKRPPRPFKGR